MATKAKIWHLMATNEGKMPSKPMTSPYDWRDKDVLNKMWPGIDWIEYQLRQSVIGGQEVTHLYQNGLAVGGEILATMRPLLEDRYHRKDCPLPIEPDPDAGRWKQQRLIELP